MHRFTTLVPLLMAAAGCKADGPPATNTPAPAAPSGRWGPIPAVADPVRDLQTVENFTEEVAHRLVDWADRTRDGLPPRPKTLLTADFRGDLPTVPPPPDARPGERGVVRWKLSGGGRPMGADAWLAAFGELLAPLRDVTDVRWKVKEAHFGSTRGTLKIRVTLSGAESRRVPSPRRTVMASFDAEAQPGPKGWLLSKLRYREGSGLAVRAERSFFTDVTSSVGLERQAPRFGRPGNDSFRWKGGAAGDVDGDGRTDLFLPSGDRNHLFRNRGDGRFEDVADAWGVAQPPGDGGSLLVDLDGDDDLDLVVGQGGWSEGGVREGRPLGLFENVGGRFVDRTADAPGWDGEAITKAFTMTAADIDGDTDLDLYVVGYNPKDRQLPTDWIRADKGGRNLLLINEGGWRFREAAAQRGAADDRWSYAASFADFDADGDADLYVANDYGPNSLFVNDGKGRFTDRAVERGVEDLGNGMGVTWGDVDADGALDLYVGNMASSAGRRILDRLASSHGGAARDDLLKLASGNSLFRADGHGGFRRVTQAQCGCLSTSWTWSEAFLDVDLDGRDDLFVTNGFISGDSVKDT